MSADQPQRVTDEHVAAALKRCGLLWYSKGMEDLLLDLRDSRALTQSQAATIAELRAEVERLKVSKALEHGEALRAVARANAAESALATANARIEKLEAALQPFADMAKERAAHGAKIGPELSAVCAALQEDKS